MVASGVPGCIPGCTGCCGGWPNSYLYPISCRFTVGFAVPVLRWFGATIGSDCSIMSFRVRHPYNLSIGDRCWIGDGVCITNPGQVTIGSDSCVSQECLLITGSHDLTTMYEMISPITIGNGVWLTTRTIVIWNGITGLTIANDVVVTPGSVVTHSLSGSTKEVRVIYGGNSARKLRELPMPDQQTHAVAQ